MDRTEDYSILFCSWQDKKAQVSNCKNTPLDGWLGIIGPNGSSQIRLQKMYKKHPSVPLAHETQIGHKNERESNTKIEHDNRKTRNNKTVIPRFLEKLNYV